MTAPDPAAPSATQPSATQPFAAQPFAKLYTNRCDLPLRAFIELFHGWIRRGQTGELLIDVHDYSHVHDGPGVILVGHACHYGMDRRDGRLGLSFRARRTPPGPVAEELAAATRAVARACQHVEQDTGGQVTFHAGELWVGFEDRLHAPNHADTFERLRPSLTTFAAPLGDGVALAHVGDAREPFGARIQGIARSLGELAALGMGGAD